MQNDPLVIAGKSYSSRLLVGTGKYRDFAQTREAIDASGAEIITVATLLETRGMAGKRVAVERNGEIVPRGRHAETLLAAGDQIEIVVAVGGG